MKETSMKAFFCILLCTLLSSTFLGCAPPMRSLGSMNEQIKSARADFEQKIERSYGKNLMELEKEWGPLKQMGKKGDNVQKLGLVGYSWWQMGSIISPNISGNYTASHVYGDTYRISGTPGRPAEAMNFTCMVLFFIDDLGKGTVQKISLQGNCLNYAMMPGWLPKINEASDGKTGPLFDLKDGKATPTSINPIKTNKPYNLI